MLEALESGRAYSSLSLSVGGGQDDDGELDPLESLGDRGARSTRSPRTARCSRPGFRVLDERERQILHLRFFEGLTQSQIAQQVGISQMHVSRLIRRVAREDPRRDRRRATEEPPRRGRSELLGAAGATTERAA